MADIPPKCIQVQPPAQDVNNNHESDDEFHSGSPNRRVRQVPHYVRATDVGPFILNQDVDFEITRALHSNISHIPSVLRQIVLKHPDIQRETAATPFDVHHIVSQRARSRGFASRTMMTVQSRIYWR